MPSHLHWSQLPPIPSAEGFAGSFAGVSRGALLFAGGANVTANQWEPNFVKTWYDTVYVLEPGATAWKLAARLPERRGYGVSITDDDSLLCLGGSNEAGHLSSCLRLRWNGDELDCERFPDLPQPCANMAGAVVGRTIYVAGGIPSPSATEALHTFWALDLADPAPKWRQLPPWPGSARIFPVAGADQTAFYLFSGAKLKAGPDGKPERDFLRDAYKYEPAHGWKRLADLPRSAVAAPSPAPLLDASRFFIISGDDGLNIHFEPLINHPGFPHETLAYDAAHDVWSAVGEAPFSRATVPVAHWGNAFIIPNGEVRPRLRTPEVWSLKVE
jgi:N-acetylneuraminic acid mutarotase